MASGSKPDPEPVNNMAEPKVSSKSNRVQFDSKASISSSAEASLRTEEVGDATSCVANETLKESFRDHAVSGPPTSSSSSLCPGYGTSLAPLDDHGYFQADGSHAVMPSDNGSMLYYFPSYDPYASGTVVGVDGQTVGQPPYFNSSGYLHHTVSYGSEAVPCYSWDSTYVGDVPNQSTSLGGSKYASASTSFAKLKGLDSAKSTGKFTSESSKSSSKPPGSPFGKGSRTGSGFVAGLANGYCPVGQFSSFGYQKQAPYSHDSPVKYKPKGRLWNGIDKNKGDNYCRNDGSGTSSELVRGPRTSSKSDSLEPSVKIVDLGFTPRKDDYNLPDFVTEYTNGKFYVIKSYSEDDVHKSIKYSVWSSTPNGNKKLDVAFHSAEEKSSEIGTKCPIFLFFSVNKSGQFVGLAEMVGQVDFSKDMNFWQVDKWMGFFPVKWHIVKDIPNGCLRHIVLENNEGKEVTFSRDTQEIPLRQGLEMLNIFKNYSAKTTLLDDFTFYEERAKSLQKSKGNTPATLREEINENGDFHKHTEPEDKFIKNSRTTKSTDPSSLINLTEGLSLNGYNQKNNLTRKPRHNSIHVVPSP